MRLKHCWRPVDTPAPRPEALTWSPRHLFAILRERLALGNTPLPKLIELVASEMLTEVCSVYVMRTGEVLELAATWGLAAGAVGSTRLRLGEGIVGLVAAMGSPINLADARAHPGFAQRPETGEAAFASLLAIPIRRSGHIIGVLTLQNREPRRFTEIEQEALETVAMLLAEMMTTAGAVEVREEGFGAALPRRFDGGHRHRPCRPRWAAVGAAPRSGGGSGDRAATAPCGERGHAARAG
jgi:phosphotransferase system enzyme I (PtsP)